MMLYKVTVLLCSLASTPDISACGRDSAIALRSVPSFAVETLGDSGSHRCEMVAARDAMMLRTNEMQRWLRTHPNKSSSDYDGSKVAIKILCEPDHEWQPQQTSDAPPAFETLSPAQNK